MPASADNINPDDIVRAARSGTSIGIVDNDRVGESNLGFKDGHNPTVWRSALLADTREPVQSEPLVPPPDYQGCPVGNDPTRSCPWGSIKDRTGGKDGDVDPGIDNVPKGLVPGTNDRRMPIYKNDENRQYAPRPIYDV